MLLNGAPELWSKRRSRKTGADLHPGTASHGATAWAYFAGSSGRNFVAASVSVLFIAI
jgi:hypothetical protein